MALVEGIPQNCYRIGCNAKLLTIINQPHFRISIRNGEYLILPGNARDILQIAKARQLIGGIRNVHIVAGSGSLLGIIGSGCAACGLPIISLLGLTGSIMYLPFHGSELSVISIVLLSLSFYAMIKAITQSKRSCDINSLKLSKVVAHDKNYL